VATYRKKRPADDEHASAGFFTSEHFGKFPRIQILTIDAVASNPAAVAGNRGAVAGNLGAVAGNLGVIAGNPGAVAGNLGAVAGNLGAIAGNPDAIAGNPGAIAGNPDAIAGNLGAIAGNPDAVAGNPGTIAGNLGSVAGMTIYAKADGEALGFEAIKPAPISPNLVKPSVQLFGAAHDSHFTVVVTGRGEATMWDAYILRKGGSWKKEASADGKSADIHVDLQTPGEAEQIQVYVQMRKGNADYGQTSEPVYVTLNP